jgi:hypothetical protein
MLLIYGVLLNVTVLLLIETGVFWYCMYLPAKKKKKSGECTEQTIATLLPQIHAARRSQSTALPLATFFAAEARYFSWLFAALQPP